jgi:hypothetical protein
LLLMAVALIAALLTLLLTDATAARPSSQTSPVQPTLPPPPVISPLPTAEVAEPTSFPEPERPLPVETFPALEAPTSVPLPAPALPSPTVSGFLPAPTITNPDEVRSLPLAQPPGARSGPEEPMPTPTPRPPRNPVLAASVAILNALWLICGAGLLIGGVVYIVVLARRNSDV